MTITAGIDVGTGCVKVALFETGKGATALARAGRRSASASAIRYRLAEEAYDAVLREAGLGRERRRLRRDDRRRRERPVPHRPLLRR